MYEDRPEKDTPFTIRRMLRLYGGVTPDGRPLWRLILAGNKRVQAAGVMKTIPKGCESDVPVYDRVQEGVFWVPRYRFDGWILERWFPGETWGSQTDWAGYKAGPDGRTQMMASAWPRHGDYFMMAGPWRSIDEAGDLKAAIREYTRQAMERPLDWNAYLRSEMATEMYERQKAAEDYEEHLASVARLSVAPVLSSISRAAQKVRNQVAAAIGGEDWHLGAIG